ncbi:hypothetical protein GCM10022234_00820 [Aeromicrobium panaciterrae]
MKDGPSSRRAVELIAAAIEGSPKSLTQIAADAGMPRTTLVNISKGRANLYVEQLILIAEGVGADASNWIALIEQERRADALASIQDDELERKRSAKRQVDANGRILPSTEELGNVASRRPRGKREEQQDDE